MKKNDILRAVVTEYGVSQDEIFSNSRVRPIPEARQMLIFLLSHKIGMTVARISEFLNRHHATVNYSFDLISSRLKFDKTTKQHYQRITEKLKSL